MIVILGALGGNLSQEMSNLNAMFQHEARLIFVSDNNITFLLKPGRHKIHSYETLKCGLIPIGNKVANISTEGLKWNLRKR
jgi:thiamine pyrophosphokinase